MSNLDLILLTVYIAYILAAILSILALVNALLKRNEQAKKLLVAALVLAGIGFGMCSLGMSGLSRL